MDPNQTTPPLNPDATDTRTIEGVAAAESAVERLSHAFASLQQELGAIQSAAAEQERLAATLDERDRAMRDYAAKLSEREYELSERHRELNEAQSRLVEEASQWKQREEAFAERERRISDAEAQIEPQRHELEAREHASSARHSEADQRFAELDAQRHELANRAQELVSQSEHLAERERGLKETAERLSVQDSALALHIEDVRRREQELAPGLESIATREQAIAQRAEVLASLEQELVQRARSLDARDAELETKEAAAREMEETAASQAAAIAQREQEQASWVTSQQHVHAELEERKTRLSELESSLRSLQESLMQKEAELVSRGAALDERAASIADAEKQRTNPDAPREPNEPIRHEPADMVRWELRRSRLKKQRALLNEQASKLIRAKQTLAMKVAEFEEALSQRENQIDERERLSASKIHLMTQVPVPASAAPVVSRSGSGRFAGLVAGFVATGITMAAIMGSAWWVAGKVQPSIYLASVRIGMEKGTGEASEEAAESWRSFHESVVMDPQMLERTAERLKRRGYSEFGSPTDVRRMLEENLVVDATSSRELAISLKGEGRQRTERLLETYTGALISIANDARSTRLDGAVSTTVMPVSASDEPLHDQRLPLFFMIAGAMGVISLVMGLVGIRIANAMRPVEQKTAVPMEDGGDDRWTIGVN